MKLSLLTMFLLTSLPTLAAPVKTADNLDYIITIDQSSNFKYCARLVCKVSKVHGDGTCEVFRYIGVVAANLTSRGVELLENNSSCMMTIELDQPVQANPRLGRNN